MSELETMFDAAVWRRRLRVAKGEESADLVLAGGSVVDVFAGDIYQADIAIADGVIAGVGAYPEGRERIDATGQWIAPAFIDAHVHTESALAWIPEFARAVVPRGTGAIVTDPHEIANIAGLPGMEAMRAAARDLPLAVFFTVPSCVPASRWESPGATFGPAEIAAMLSWPESVGLGELMNFPGVLAGDDDIAAKLAVSAGRRRDGHAPGLRGAGLQAYVGSGPGSDHEASQLDEAMDKLRAGQSIMIRDGSAARNLPALLPIVTDATYPRCCFCSDDRDAHALLHDGHMDVTIRQAIAMGLDPVRAIRLATWNAADYWRLDGWGAVAPGYRANLVLLADLRNVRVATTIHDGRIVAQNGEMLVDGGRALSIPSSLRDTMHVAPLSLADLRLEPEPARQAVGVIPGEIVTRLIDVEPTLSNGAAVAVPERDLLKLVCVERHHATGRVGVGYVQGFGLRRGALASSISHDAHNIVAVGADDADILAAVAAVAESGGGLAAVADGEILAHMALPIAGILSDRRFADVVAQSRACNEAAHGLGWTGATPFLTLAFLALSVIPEARVTDRGFVHVG